MRKFIDLTGCRFGRLVVISRAENDKWGAARWNCRCDCGKETIVITASLKKGNTQSCGCYNIERTRAANTVHGYKINGIVSNTYNAWRSLKSRCGNKEDKQYNDYGGRGILVCSRWGGSNGFLNFLEDMGECPAGGSIDRVDNDGPYSPENCRGGQLLKSRLIIEEVIC